MTPQSGISPDAIEHAYFIQLNMRVEADVSALKKALHAIPMHTAQQAQRAKAHLSSVIALSAAACNTLFGSKPEALTHFPVLANSPHPLPDTQTDLLLHVRATIFHHCFALADKLVQSLLPYCEVVETQHAFLRDQKRDFTGFVDGTENPSPEERNTVTLVAEGEWAGGSFVHQQRYLHNLAAWQHLKTAEQEKIIGRSKAADIELEDSVKPPTAHISRVVIEEQGEELAIMRHSLPFGTPGVEHGLMFIAYSCNPAIFSKMLTRMFSPQEDGYTDALLRFTTAVSGGAYFAPSIDKLAQLG